MIRAFKDVLKRYWPALRLRAILFFTLLFVAALPGFGAVFLRVYENTLVQQTEAELIAQAAVLSGVYRAGWTGGKLPDEPHRLEPQLPSIDLHAIRILPEQPEPARVASVADPRAARVASQMVPIVADTARTTLASIRILDASGTVVLGGTELGRSYGFLPEVKAAGSGHAETVLRRRGHYAPRYWLEFLSRAADVRVHHVRPVMDGGKVIGLVMLSRSPRGLFLGIYQDRGKIALGVAGIFTILVLLAGLLSRGIARPIEALEEATQNVARGPIQVPDPPPTAAIEIRGLYESFAAMAERIERRSRYLKDFAAAISHELKTPIAGIRGALELLQEHGATMSIDERQRFLGNAMADAARLSHLLQRLLDLARADMAVAPEHSASFLTEVLAPIADAHQSIGIESRFEPGLPAVAAPAELLQAVFDTLVENSRQAGSTRVRFAASRNGAGILIRVEDDGRGVGAADHERIFEPFHTGRRSEGGSGLGLSIARSLLAACNGTIVSRPADRGACFEIRLPAA